MAGDADRLHRVALPMSRVDILEVGRILPPIVGQLFFVESDCGFAWTVFRPGKVVLLWAQ
jgi:hypothetical protein